MGVKILSYDDSEKGPTLNWEVVATPDLKKIYSVKALGIAKSKKEKVINFECKFWIETTNLSHDKAN